jgi:hypothetical protein
MVLPARLDKPLSTAGPVGFAFSATVPADMLAADGAVAVPAGSVVRGVVTGLHPGKGDVSLIRVDVDLLEMKGESYGIRAEVTGVTPSTPAGTTVQQQGGAPALGTILGKDAADKLLGRDSTAVLPETTISLGSGEPGSAALPAGSVLTIKLDTAIAVIR